MVTYKCLGPLLGPDFDPFAPAQDLLIIVISFAAGINSDLEMKSGNEL